MIIFHSKYTVCDYFSTIIYKSVTVDSLLRDEEIVMVNGDKIQNKSELDRSVSIIHWERLIL